MDNFRNKQPRKRANSSVDGFIQPRRNGMSAQQRIGESPSKNVPRRPNTARQIGDFSGKEGLTPRNRIRSVQTGSVASQTAPAFDEPLLINKKKKSRFKRIIEGLKPRNLKKKWQAMSRKKKTLTVAITLLVITLLVGGFLALKGYININKVLQGGGGAAALEDDVDPSKLRGEGDGRVNILLLGRGGDGHEGADLTDTIIIVSIDPIAKEAALVSVPRDLYVPVPGSGSMKINAAFATGKDAALAKTSRQKQTDEVKKQAENAGYELLEQTIENNLGIGINYRGIIDFDGFQQAIDTVGGIEINAPTAVAETMRINGKTYRLDVKPGQQHMDGFKALAYSRSRHTSARGDFDRSERQRLIILALKDKILSAGTFSNPSKISGLLDTLGSRVQTDFSLQDLTRLYALSKEIQPSKISSIGLADPPNNYVVTDMVAGQSVVVPRAGVRDYSEIKAYLRSVLRDSFIRNENASIMVLNGTETAGLATAKGDELKSFGYNVTEVGNAPTKEYTKTTVVDLRNGSKKYTKNYLEKRFGVGAVTSLPDATIQPGTADFVIILGSDQSGT